MKFHIGDINSDARGSGARANVDKPDYAQIPLHLMEEVVRVFMLGEKKYARFNWLKGMAWSVPYACAQRHLAAWYRGETVDPESGQNHLAHVICNMLMLLAYETGYPEGDDRPSQYFLGRPGNEASVTRWGDRVKPAESESDYQLEYEHGAEDDLAAAERFAKIENDYEPAHADEIHRLELEKLWAENDKRLVEPSERLVEPSERLVEPSERLAEPSERLAEPSERLCQPSPLLDHEGYQKKDKNCALHSSKLHGGALHGGVA